MEKAERYRAFARKCTEWANRAQTIEHRERLLSLATTWAEAAARLDHQYVLLDKFTQVTIEAQSSLHSAIEGINGAVLIEKANGIGRTEQQRRAVPAKASECERLAHNLSDPANKSLYFDLAHQWRELAWQAEMLDREHWEC